MRELKKGTKIIGVDHGYGNIKTANMVMPTGISAYPTAPTFDGNILQYDGTYYRIEEGHKGFEDDSFLLNEIYTQNNADILFDSAVLSALISSCCFLGIDKGEDGYIRLSCESN